MAQAKKHILPFFIPHLGCPQQCIFCDQHIIAVPAAPTPEAVWQAILALPAAQRQDYELAFYGGSFTALPVERQEYYLEPVRQALTAGLLGAARISTRPDCLDEVVLARLRHFGVGTVELGVQSMYDEVLRRARRGHTAQQSLAAVRRLQSEMNYGLLPLPRLCELAAGQIDGAVGQFWQSLAAVLQQGEPLALPEIWQQLLTAQSQNWHLLPEDLQTLTELGQGLGSSGLSNQQRLLALTEQRLQRLAAEADERRGRLARLLGGLGWCSGLLLVCLWL